MRANSYTKTGYTTYPYTHTYVNPNHMFYGLKFESAVYFKSEHEFLLWCNKINGSKDIDYAAVPIHE